MKSNELHETLSWMSDSQKILADSKQHDVPEQMRIYRYFNKQRISQEDALTIEDHNRSIARLARTAFMEAE